MSLGITVRYEEEEEEEDSLFCRNLHRRKKLIVVDCLEKWSDCSALSERGKSISPLLLFLEPIWCV